VDASPAAQEDEELGGEMGIVARLCNVDLIAAHSAFGRSISTSSLTDIDICYLGQFLHAVYEP